VCEVVERGCLAADLLDRDDRISLWISDECHKTECDQMLGWARWTDPRHVVGLTATPWRSQEGEGLSLFDELVYDYPPDAAMRDGVVLPPDIRPYTGPTADLDEVVAQMIQDVIAETGGAPGVVNAKNTTDADSLAEYLTAHGIESRAVHYQSSAGKDDLIDQLRVGDLDCLVHCNMLAEGVDLPWLTWICLRRPSASRVRFAQEVGRVVRTHRGKDRAIVLDPHDLFNSFGLDYEAVLSGGGQEDTRSEVDALADEYLAIVTDPDGEEVSHGLMRRMIARGRGVSEVRAWLRRTAFGMRAAGLEDMKIESTSWRADPASDAQLRYAHRKVRAPSIQRVAQNLDDRHRKVLRGACYALDREALTKGDVSDFLTILCVLEEHGGMPDDLDL
jgi:hypothetical protein